MPHDHNGSPLKVGDYVYVIAQIETLSEGEKECNAMIRVLKPKSRQTSYEPLIALNTHQLILRENE